MTYIVKVLTGVSIADKNGVTHVGTLTGHRATEVGTYTATASLKEGYSWPDGTTGDKKIVWRIDKADRGGPRNLTVVRPTKEGVNDGRIVNTTTEMEYRKVGTTAWTDCQNGEVTGLSAGDYEVRYKETKSYNASKAVTYTVPIWEPAHTYGAWSKDDTNHWHECTGASCTDRAGSVKDKASHVYSDAADTTCNVCGYVRTVAPPIPSTPSTPSTPGSPSAPSAPAAPVEPDTLNVTVSNIKVQNYKGTGITPKIMVKDPATRKKLKQGKHYTVSYENNVNVGTAAIVIRGIEANGYSGVKHVYFTIQPQSVAKKVRAKVNGKRFLYTGNELTPGVNLTYNKRKLTEGVDYVLSYSNNVGKGSAKITITGIGNYTGSKTVKFRITGPKLKDAKVSLVPNGTPYPDITVTYAGKTRTMGQDYTIKYPKIVKPGKNRIIVKGRGNFSGSVKLTYYQEGL